MSNIGIGTEEKINIQDEYKKLRKEQTELCQKEIDSIFKKYNCYMDVKFIISTTGITPLITIIAKD